MSLTINTNLAALNAQRNLNHTEMMLAGTMQRLSSGLRINSAADDVAGYAISERMQGQVNGLNQATQNIQDGVSLAQTAQGAINDVTQMLQRVRELAVEYANGTTSETDKTAIGSEVNQLVSEINRVGEATTFNGVKLLAGGATITFQVGANEGETIGVATISLSTVVGSISVSNISGIDSAISKVAGAAGEFGSVQDRIQFTQSNLEVYSQNLTAAVSSLKDVNMAAEMTQFTKNTVLQQAGISVLAHANQNPQAILRLIE